MYQILRVENSVENIRQRRLLIITENTMHRNCGPIHHPVHYLRAAKWRIPPKRVRCQRDLFIPDRFRMLRRDGVKSKFEKSYSIVFIVHKQNKIKN